MNAPLSRYLTQFSAPLLASIPESPVRFESRISLTVDELEARLAESVAAARSECEAQLVSEIAALAAEREAAVAEALAAARADWVASQGEILATQMVEAVTELRERIADGLARILRPVLFETLVTRTARELSDALDKLLAASDCPPLSVRGPVDLLDRLRQRQSDVAIEWVVADVCEVTILADAMRMETCLGAALPELAATES